MLSIRGQGATGDGGGPKRKLGDTGSSGKTVINTSVITEHTIKTDRQENVSSQL